VKLDAVLPGATIGVLGSGQLGRMFAIAARKMGYRVHTYSPDDDTPTGHIADKEYAAPYDDLKTVRAFAQSADVITFEFENVPAATAAEASKYCTVRPSGEVLHITQHRLREKQFLRNAGFPVTPFSEVRSGGEVADVMATLGRPAVLKTAGWGYDGKGQVRVESTAHALEAWDNLKADEAVLEAFVDFDREISVVVGRGVDARFAHYGAIENTHRNHILDVSVAPARIAPAKAAEAVEIARGIVEKLDLVGVLCVEFFLGRDGNLLVNELAPRPHNSGHFSFDACLTSQFEQQVRAICGLPLGSTELLRPAAMANLLGDLWNGGTPNWEAACAFPDVKLHLYGKAEARPGRKMGHLTALATSAVSAHDRVLAARAALTDTKA
jgi:5-(carboxyamino)imidazole ribonucleotide synthase